MISRVRWRGSWMPLGPIFEHVPKQKRQHVIDSVPCRHPISDNVGSRIGFVWIRFVCFFMFIFGIAFGRRLAPNSKVVGFFEGLCWAHCAYSFADVLCNLPSKGVFVGLHLYEFCKKKSVLKLIREKWRIKVFHKKTSSHRSHVVDDCGSNCLCFSWGVGWQLFLLLLHWGQA